MNRFITSDWHLGEARPLIRRPQFKTPTEMVDGLVTIHNEIVKPDDLVYVVGDVCWREAPQWLEHVDRFNGIKVLVRGNHDRVFTDAELKPYFEEIIAEVDGISVEVGDIGCWITHYPTQSKTDKFNLVGHIHGRWQVQKNMLNVGIDVNHYRPYNMKEDIPFFFNAICKYYDDDVWVSDHEANAMWNNRGAIGSYKPIDK